MSCTLLTVKKTGLNKDSQIQFTSQHSNLKNKTKQKTMYNFAFIKILQKMNRKSKMQKIQNTRQARRLATRQE